MNGGDFKIILTRLDDLTRLIQGQHVSPWLTTAEAAAYLKCSARQIEKLTRLGLLPYQRQDPTADKSPRLYHRKHLTAYLVAGRNPQTHRLTPAEKQLVEDLLG